MTKMMFSKSSGMSPKKLDELNQINDMDRKARFDPGSPHSYIQDDYSMNSEP
jgi:hypothetical protein